MKKRLSRRGNVQPVDGFTLEELWFLDSWGGRTVRDVRYDINGQKYVMMYTPHGDEMVYL